jgi:Tol biopolymer transport system component
MGPDGYFDVFRMKPNGKGVKLMTHRKIGCPQKHNDNPAWHPSGEYIVFTAENENTPFTKEEERFAWPGTGIGHDLYLMTANGKEFHRLTSYRLTKPMRAVIHPQFSHDGRKLAWSERVRSGKSFGGGWVIKIADFKEPTPSGKPARLRNVRKIKPVGKSCFYEVHDFSADDKRLLFSGDLQPGQPHVGLDIYEVNLKTGKLKRLTDSDDDWDEHAHYSPDGEYIAWMSSTGLDIEYGSTEGVDWADYLKTELWIMEADGTDRQQLTHFNTPGYPEYMDGARCIVSDSSWSPDGKSLIVCVAWFKGNTKGIKLVTVRLDK